MIRVQAGGKSGTLQTVFPVSSFDSSRDQERADPHGVAVRVR